MMLGDHMSKSILNRILCKCSLCSHRLVNKSFLTDRKRKKRVEWDRNKEGWTNENWNQVISNDECVFRMLSNCGRGSIRRFKNENFRSIFTNSMFLGAFQDIIF